MFNDEVATPATDELRAATEVSSALVTPTR
jgi:hypothetical protein